jgi:hypothetical protein
MWSAWACLKGHPRRLSILAMRCSMLASLSCRAAFSRSNSSHLWFTTCAPHWSVTRVCIRRCIAAETDQALG